MLLIPSPRGHALFYAAPPANRFPAVTCSNSNAIALRVPSSRTTLHIILLLQRVSDQPKNLTFRCPHDLSLTPFVHVQVHGSSVGGDADELRLLSTSDKFLNLRAYGGSFDFLSTKVSYAFRIIRNILGDTSWSTSGSNDA